MKTYDFSEAGVSYRMSGLTLKIKDDYCVPIRAEHLRRVKRLIEDKLIDIADVAAMRNDAISISFTSEVVARDLCLPHGIERMLRLLVSRIDADGKTLPITEENVVTLLMKIMDEDSETNRTFRQVMEDAYPKAQAPTS